MNKNLEIIKHYLGYIVGKNCKVDQEYDAIIKTAEKMANRIEYLEKQLAKSPAERENDKLYQKLAGR